VLTNLKFSRQNSEKYTNMKFIENPSSRIQVVPREQTDGQTDMMKLTASFRNFASAPKNQSFVPFKKVITPTKLYRYTSIQLCQFAGFLNVNPGRMYSNQ
jgi:hypothetical protein